MKTLFIPAKAKVDIKPLLKKVNLKGKIGLVTVIQFEHLLKESKKILNNTVIGGIILGCDVSAALKIKDKVDSFLFIGSGEFHPLEIAYQTKKPVYIANPLSNKVSKISEEEVKKREKRAKGVYFKFLAAKKVGFLVSVKPGQYHPKQYLDVKAKIKQALNFKKKLNKESYIFIFNTLNFNELENYKDIDCWINLSCPKIALEDYKKISKPIINAKEVITK